MQRVHHVTHHVLLRHRAVHVADDQLAVLVQQVRLAVHHATFVRVGGEGDVVLAVVQRPRFQHVGRHTEALERFAVLQLTAQRMTHLAGGGGDHVHAIHLLCHLHDARDRLVEGNGHAVGEEHHVGVLQQRRALNHIREGHAVLEDDAVQVLLLHALLVLVATQRYHHHRRVVVQTLRQRRRRGGLDITESRLNTRRHFPLRSRCPRRTPPSRSDPLRLIADAIKNGGPHGSSD